jgi:pyruvate dehydrogenase phosphatase
MNAYSDLMDENYITPPYLTAEPEIIHQRLTPKDKFLVIASDGLWDMVQPDKVVKLIAGHMEGKEVLVSPVETHKLGLKDINENLKDRKNHLLNVPARNLSFGVNL